MLLTLVIVLIFLSVILHETGHAYEMHKQGIQLKECGLGIPVKFLPPILTLKFKRFLPETEFKLHALLLGAYVQPTDEGELKLSGLSYRDQSLVYGAGIVANLIFAFVLYLAALTVRTDLSLSLPFILRFFIAITLPWLIWRYKIFFSAFVIPALGFITGAALIAAFIYFPWQEVSGGPIMIAKMSKSQSGNLHDALLFGGLMSINLGLINMIPIYQLDGGRIVDLLFKKQKSAFILTAYRKAGNILFLLLIVMAIASDIIHLF